MPMAKRLLFKALGVFKRLVFVVLALAALNGVLFVALGANTYASREPIVTISGLLTACLGALSWFGLQGERLRMLLPWHPKVLAEQPNEPLAERREQPLQQRLDALRAREDNSIGFAFFMLAAGLSWLVIGNALLVWFQK